MTYFHINRKAEKFVVMIRENLENGKKLLVFGKSLVSGKVLVTWE